MELREERLEPELFPPDQHANSMECDAVTRGECVCGGGCAVSSEAFK